MSSTQDAQVQNTYSLSFTQGFVLGQLSVVILIGAFIKFFIFGEAPDQDSQLSTLSPSHRRSVSFTSHHRQPRPSTPRASGGPRAIDGNRHLRAQGPSSPGGGGGGASSSSLSSPSPHVLRLPSAATPAAILAKTYYDVHGHPAESLDWFNVLVAQTIAQLRADAAADGAILQSLNGLLNGPRRPRFLDAIRVTEIALGDEFPIFSNCRIHPVAPGGEDAGGGGVGDSGSAEDGGRQLQALMDVDLSDVITLGIETVMVLDYPRPRTAVLPVALSVSVVRFSGTLAISFLPAVFSTATNSAPPPTPSSASLRPDINAKLGNTKGPVPPPPPPPSPPTSRTPTNLSFSFLPDYTLALSTRSLLGSRSRLQDVPKIAQLVESQLRTWFEDRCVAPRMQQIAVPSLWPRMKNTVGGGGGGETVGSPPRPRPPSRDVSFGATKDGMAAVAATAGGRRDVGEASRQQEVDREWEGLRRRGGLDSTPRTNERERSRPVEYEIPGALPGMVMQRGET